MANTPRIELDSRSADAIDGRQIRAVTFHDLRMEYVAGVLKRLELAAAGSPALVVGSGRGLLAHGLARLGFDVVAVDPSATATAIAREATDREGLSIVHKTAPAQVWRFYVEHYNRHRPHRALSLDAPDPPNVTAVGKDNPGRLHRRDLLSGLVHEHRRAA